MRIFDFRVVSTLIFLIFTRSVCAASDTYGFESGLFEQLMLAVDSQGNITGYYQEEQGVAPSKTCTFYLAGRAKRKEIDVLTWNAQVLPGQLKSEVGGVMLKIERGRDHPGCGLVLLPQISEGIAFDQVVKAAWSELRIISSERAYFYSAPQESRKLRSFIIHGDVVGVISKSGEWQQVEYRGAKRTMKAWIHESDAGPLSPPLKDR